MAPSFHVVVPSLPGFGFSDAPAAPGMSNPRHPGRGSALHLNFVPDSYALFVNGDLTSEEETFLRVRAAWSDQSGAYSPMPPRSWVERGYDVARWTEMPRGGHFAALEAP